MPFGHNSRTLPVSQAYTRGAGEDSILVESFVSGGRRANDRSHCGRKQQSRRRVFGYYFQTQTFLVYFLIIFACKCI